MPGARVFTRYPAGSDAGADAGTETTGQGLGRIGGREAFVGSKLRS